MLVPPTAIDIATVTPILGEVAAVLGLVDDNILGNSIIVFDGNLNIINKFPRKNYYLTSFSPDGCHLRSIKYIDAGFVIREIDFYGAETRQTAALSTDSEDGTKIYQFNLSPSGRWLAYKVVDQIEMSMAGSKIQDVKLLEVNEQTPQKVLRLTERSGARPARPTWSLDSRFLAYTDYDEAGVIQIYIYNPDEKREAQITDFGLEMKDHEIQILSWAPNSLAIAFSIVGLTETEEGGIKLTDNGALGVIFLPDINLKWINLKGFENPILANHYMAGSTTLWWSKDSQELLIPFSLETVDNTIRYLAWYDITQDEVVHLLPDSDFPEKGDYFWKAFPINDLNKIGVFGDKVFYVYQRNSKVITEVKKEFIFLENSVFFSYLTL